MNTIFGFGGMFYRIVGMSAMYAIIMPEIEPIRSPTDVFWKKMLRLMTAKSHNGRKIVAKDTDGYL